MIVLASLFLKQSVADLIPPIIGFDWLREKKGP